MINSISVNSKYHNTELLLNNREKKSQVLQFNISEERMMLEDLHGYVIWDYIVNYCLSFHSAGQMQNIFLVYSLVCTNLKISYET